MLLILDLIINIWGFIFFVVCGLMLILIISPDVIDINNGYRGQSTGFFTSFVNDEVDFILAAVISFLIALVFLYNFLACLAQVVDTKCLNCWQTKSFIELIDLLGYKGRGTKRKDVEEAIAQHSQRTTESLSSDLRSIGSVKSQHFATGVEGMPTVERRMGEEGDLSSGSLTMDALNLKPMRSDLDLPKWKEDTRKPFFIGLGFDKHKNWSYRGFIPAFHGSRQPWSKHS